MNISSTLKGKSEQLDNVDLMGGPRDFTVTKAVVREGHEQPLVVTLAEYDRPWLPGLTMRRLIAAMWGEESDDYVGHRVRLFRDPDVAFGGSKTGGTRISHASHIDKTLTVSLPTSKGKFGAFTVKPLTDPPRVEPARIPDTLPRPSLDDIANCTDPATLRTWWTANPSMRDQISARKAELDTATQGTLNKGGAQ